MRAKTTDYTHWIGQNLQPDAYCVGTVKQKVKSWLNGSPIWVTLTEDTINERAGQFTARLSKAIYGNTAYRRFKLTIPNAITLEGNGNGRSCFWLSHKDDPASLRSREKVRYHLNILLRKPDWMEFERLEEIVKNVWQSCDWTLPDINIQKRTGDCTGYSFKEGPETLVTKTLNFGRQRF